MSNPNHLWSYSPQGSSSSSATASPASHHHHNHPHHHHPHASSPSGGGGAWAKPRLQPHQQQQQQTRQQQRAPAAPSSSSSAGSTVVFSRAMRDRQARSRDPYGSGSDEEYDLRGGGREGKVRTDSLGKSGAGGKKHESYESALRRNTAAAYLHDPELLLMRSIETGQSITAVRHHLQQQMCMYDGLPADQPTAGAGSPRRQPPAATQCSRHQGDW